MYDEQSLSSLFVGMQLCRPVLCLSFQVCNNLPYAVEVYYKLSIDANGRCGEVEPGDTFSLPCEVVYTEPHQILFKPRDGRCVRRSSFFHSV